MVNVLKKAIGGFKSERVRARGKLVSSIEMKATRAGGAVGSLVGDPITPAVKLLRGERTVRVKVKSKKRFVMIKGKAVSVAGRTKKRFKVVKKRKGKITRRARQLFEL